MSANESTSVDSTVPINQMAATNPTPEPLALMPTLPVAPTETSPIAVVVLSLLELKDNDELATPTDSGPPELKNEQNSMQHSPSATSQNENLDAVHINKTLSTLQSSSPATPSEPKLAQAVMPSDHKGDGIEKADSVEMPILEAELADTTVQKDLDDNKDEAFIDEKSPEEVSRRRNSSSISSTNPFDDNVVAK